MIRRFRGLGRAALLCAACAGGARAETAVDADLSEDSPRRTAKPVAAEKVVLEEDESEDPPRPEDEPAPTDAGERPSGAAAPRGDRESREAPSPSAWLQLGVVQDVAFVSGNDVCSPSSQIDGRFTCLRASGSQYHGTPLAGSAGSASGPALGPTRAALTASFPLGSSLSAGVRVGYAFAGGGPTPDGGKKFLPLLLEAQGHYWFAGEAFSTRSAGAFLMLAGGLAQVDARTRTQVREDTSVPPPVNQLDNPPVQRLDAWQKAGVGFASAGAGAFVPVGGPLAITMDVKAGVLFPTPAFALSASVSIALGL